MRLRRRGRLPRIVAWLKEDRYGFEEVVAVLVDVGQVLDVEESVARGRAAAAHDFWRPFSLAWDS